MLLSKKRIRTIAIWLAAPVIYVLATAYYYSRLIPADGTKTYAALRLQGVPLSRAVRVAAPPDHICVFGDPLAGLWTFPSGPPAYLFDPNGHLVDYTCDVGDSQTFQETYRVHSGIDVDMELLDKRFTAIHVPAE